MEHKSILGNLIICPECQKKMVCKKDTFTPRSCTLVCKDCKFEREVNFPENAGGYIGDLK